jgi:hypothetical protein
MTILNRRQLLMAGAGAALMANAAQAAERPSPETVLRTWYRLVLELVRHTATYSPPVASRAFAYLGVASYEIAASGDPSLNTLAGQLSGLEGLPARDGTQVYDDAVAINAALEDAVKNFFGNTGPTGQRVMERFSAKWRERVAAGVPQEVVTRSIAYGQAVGSHVLKWSEGDGGAAVENMGFPYTYELTDGPAHWVPTSAIRQQQLPLLPNWGRNRTFAMPDGKSCSLPAPPDYSEDKASTFYKEALEVYETKNNLTSEQKAIARFWSDDPMLSPTPPGHWISIALQILDDRKAGLAESADVLARLGVTLADAFIACWATKFEFDLLRPVTYIKRFIDPKWEALLITPPFPEYPSGHSTQSGAAALVLAHAFGENFSFSDATHERDNIKPRSYPSFWAAAEEAGVSRLYGGIHFRSAVTRGLEQGRCVGAYATALKTRR